jgi:hypothetical protein
VQCLNSAVADHVATHRDPRQAHQRGNDTPRELQGCNSQATDEDVRSGLLKLAGEKSAHIRTWRAERERIERIATVQRDEMTAVRAHINSQLIRMLQATAEEKRKLAEALGIRAAVYRAEHEP